MLGENPSFVLPPPSRTASALGSDHTAIPVVRVEGSPNKRDIARARSPMVAAKLTSSALRESRGAVWAHASGTTVAPSGGPTFSKRMTAALQVVGSPTEQKFPRKQSVVAGLRPFPAKPERGDKEATPRLGGTTPARSPATPSLSPLMTPSSRPASASIVGMDRHVLEAKYQHAVKTIDVLEDRLRQAKLFEKTTKKKLKKTESKVSKLSEMNKRLSVATTDSGSQLTVLANLDPLGDTASERSDTTSDGEDMAQPFSASAGESTNPFEALDITGLLPKVKSILGRSGEDRLSQVKASFKSETLADLFVDVLNNASTVADERMAVDEGAGDTVATAGHLNESHRSVRSEKVPVGVTSPHDSHTNASTASPMSFSLTGMGASKADAIGSSPNSPEKAEQSTSQKEESVLSTASESPRADATSITKALLRYANSVAETAQNLKYCLESETETTTVTDLHHALDDTLSMTADVMNKVAAAMAHTDVDASKECELVAETAANSVSEDYRRGHDDGGAGEEEEDGFGSTTVANLFREQYARLREEMKEKALSAIRSHAETQTHDPLRGLYESTRKLSSDHRAVRVGDDGALLVTPPVAPLGRCDSDIVSTRPTTAGDAATTSSGNAVQPMVTRTVPQVLQETIEACTYTLATVLRAYFNQGDQPLPPLQKPTLPARLDEGAAQDIQDYRFTFEPLVEVAELARKLAFGHMVIEDATPFIEAVQDVLRESPTPCDTSDNAFANSVPLMRVGLTSDHFSKYLKALVQQYPLKKRQVFGPVIKILHLNYRRARLNWRGLYELEHLVELKSTVMEALSHSDDVQAYTDKFDTIIARHRVDWAKKASVLKSDRNSCWSEFVAGLTTASDYVRTQFGIDLAAVEMAGPSTATIVAAAVDAKVYHDEEIAKEQRRGRISVHWDDKWFVSKARQKFLDSKFSTLEEEDRHFSENATHGGKHAEEFLRRVMKGPTPQQKASPNYQQKGFQSVARSPSPVPGAVRRAQTPSDQGRQR